MIAVFLKLYALSRKCIYLLVYTNYSMLQYMSTEFPFDMGGKERNSVNSSMLRIRNLVEMLQSSENVT